jgi:hypothetical protein
MDLAESDWDDFARVRQSAIMFDLDYRGLSVVSLGGPLEGKLRLGVNGARPIWRTRQGQGIFRCGSHAGIQCAVVSSVDGRVGCSWSGEFTPLFDSMRLALENAAAWGSMQGWKYVVVEDAASSSMVDLFDDITSDDAASGELSAWWIGDDHAVVAQQYLNPSRSAHPQVSVLAKTSVAEKEIRHRFASAGVSPVAFQVVEAMGVVPMLPAP